MARENGQRGSDWPRLRAGHSIRCGISRKASIIDNRHRRSGSLYKVTVALMVDDFGEAGQDALEEFQIRGGLQLKFSNTHRLASSWGLAALPLLEVAMRLFHDRSACRDDLSSEQFMDAPCYL
jgi:hypothetical protein